jgi:hypothetical protein
MVLKLTYERGVFLSPVFEVITPSCKFVAFEKYLYTKKLSLTALWRQEILNPINIIKPSHSSDQGTAA